MTQLPKPSKKAMEFVAKMQLRDKRHKELAEKCRKITFEEALKHLDKHYIGEKQCDICDELEALLHKHGFSLTKYWDHDDE